MAADSRPASSTVAPDRSAGLRSREAGNAEPEPVTTPAKVENRSEPEWAPAMEEPARPEPVVAAEPDAWVTRFAGDPPRQLAMPVPVFPVGLDWEQVPGAWVEARVTIDGEGTVIEVEGLDSNAPDLVGPTLHALREARYEPVTDPNGVPIQVDFVERVEF